MSFRKTMLNGVIIVLKLLKVIFSLLNYGPKLICISIVYLRS